MPAPERIFLGWERPPPTSARDWLMARAAPGPVLDLSDVLVVLPGGRAGRVLIASLLESASLRGLPIFPPRVTTPAGLLRLLYPPVRSADNAARRLAWARALLNVDADVRAAIVARPPTPDDHAAWLEIARLLGSTHTALAAEGLTFADAARKGESMQDFPDANRWAALAAVHAEYVRVLAAAGLVDEQTARIEACRAGVFAPLAARSVVLAGLSEISKITRAALAMCAAPVSALVFAPETIADCFDDLGAVRPPAWAEPTIAVREDQLRIVDSPIDQADAALEALASLSPAPSPAEIVIGVPDVSVAPCIIDRAVSVGITARDAAGSPVARSAPVRLLADVADLAGDRSFAALTALIRHPDVERFINTALHLTTEDYLARIDDYACEHLPMSADGPWYGKEGTNAMLTSVRAAAGALCGPLLEAAPRPISHWTEPILALLRAAYPRPLNPDVPADHAVISAGRAIDDAALSLAALPRPLDAPVTAAAALRFVLSQVAEAAIPAQSGGDAIELLGWLELCFDDSPVAVVTGFNESFIPSRAGLDPLLPESFRAALDLPTSATRLARDAYLFSLLVHSRRCVTLIGGRRTAQGDPLLPSRLMFACGDEALPGRVALWHKGTTPRRPARPAPAVKSGFAHLPRAPYQPVNSMSVSAFKTFIASPYDFYLKYVLGLKESAPPGSELDHADFGSLIHSALADLVHASRYKPEDPAHVGEYLAAALDERIAKRFGGAPAPAVRIQREHALARLKEFAAWQSGRRRDGWRIAHAEWVPEKSPSLKVAEGEMLLTGRIDRIDIHDEHGYQLLDYKTSESVKDPDKAHRAGRGAAWIDLQLPLYRYLSAAVIGDKPASMAYLVLPASPEEQPHRPAPWTHDELRQADDMAREVVGKVLRGEFFDLGDRPPKEGTFAALTGLSFLGGALDEEEDE